MFHQIIILSRQAPIVAPNVSKLLLCLLIDILGTSSVLLPIVGEFTDIAYVPIAALVLRSSFQGSNVVFALEFAPEEILPLPDIILGTSSILLRIVGEFTDVAYVPANGY